MAQMHGEEDLRDDVKERDKWLLEAEHDHTVDVVHFVRRVHREVFGVCDTCSEVQDVVDDKGEEDDTAPAHRAGCVG